MENMLLNKIVTGTNPYEKIMPNSTVIIGRADLGPAEVPIEGLGIDNVVKWFGPESELTRAYIEFRRNSNSQVFLVKENGNPGIAYLTGIDPEIYLIKVVSLDYNLRANRMQARVVTRQTGRYFEVAQEGSQDIFSMKIDGLKIGDIVDSINRLAYAGSIRYYAAGEEYVDADLLIDQYANFQNGADRLIDPFFRIIRILDGLKDISFKQIVLVNTDFSLEYSPYGYPYEAFARYAMEREKTGVPCFINIGIDPAKLNDPSSDIDLFHAEKLPTFHINPYLNLIVGVGNIMLSSGNSYLTNMAPAYAGVIAETPTGESTTNKEVKGLESLKYVFSDEEIKRLASMGYVVMTVDKRRGKNPRVYRGVNLLKSTGGSIRFLADTEGGPAMIDEYRSEYLSNIANVSLIIDVFNRLRNALDPYIGEMGTKESDVMNTVVREMAFYPDSIKQSRVVVSKTRPGIDPSPYLELGHVYDLENLSGFAENINVEVYIVPYGVMEEIKVSISIW